MLKQPMRMIELKSMHELAQARKGGTTCEVHVDHHMLDAGTLINK